ncbi:MAG: efflux RND transporter periplasmic adaptor subunit [Terriglobales bacterium]
MSAAAHGLGWARGGRGWALVAVVVLSGVWLAARSWHGGAMPPSALVRRGDLDEYVRCRGSLAARKAAILFAPERVENQRIVFLVPGGSRVRQGQVVIRLDVSALQQTAQQRALALQTAKAKLAQAQTQARITRQQDVLALVEDQVQEGRAQLQERQESILSRIAGQESQLALATAQAQVAAEKAEGRLHAAAAAAQLQALRQARDKAATQLRREQTAVAESTLRAPIAGLVTYMTNYSNFSDPHPYRVGDTVSAGDKIAQIPDLNTLEIHGNLPQNDRGQVRLGDRVEVRTPALPEMQFTGRLAKLSALTRLDINGTWPPERTFRFTAPLEHPDPRLRPDMSVTARIITRQLRQVALVPARALFTRRGKAIVYVLAGGRFRPQPVTVLGRNPAQAAVRGVAPGMRVALVAPGAKPRKAAANPTGAEGRMP